MYSELKSRRRKPADRWDLIAFGNPDYGSKDAASVSQLRGMNFSALPHSAEELEAISSIYPRQTRKYLGMEASEEAAKKVNKNARYIHFATHGFFNSRTPLDSALILSLPKQNGSKENGLLQA